MTGVSCTHLGSRALLRLAGPDTRSLLQGIVTNDVEELTPERNLHTALLSPQGKFLFEFFLWEDGGDVLVEARAERLDELMRRLMLYRLRAKVQIAPDPRAVLAVPGEAALELLGLPREPGVSRRDGEALLCADPRLAAMGARVVLPKAAIPSFLETHGLVQDPLAYERHRLALGVPEAGDLVVDRSTALEACMDRLNGVSFAKGCFVGQEVTARTKHRGLLKRRLLPVRVEGPLPEPGTRVMAGEREAGEIRSGLGERAICLLRLELLDQPDTRLTAGEATIHPERPAWLQD